MFSLTIWKKYQYSIKGRNPNESKFRKIYDNQPTKYEGRLNRIISKKTSEGSKIKNTIRKNRILKKQARKVKKAKKGKKKENRKNKLKKNTHKTSNKSSGKRHRKIKLLKKVGKHISKRKQGSNGKRKSNTRKGRNSCQDIQCLNNLLKVLKIDKDTVQNFIQQKKRIDSRIRLAGSYIIYELFLQSFFLTFSENKRNKSNTVSSSLELLEDSLGGTKLLNNGTPVCAGRLVKSKNDFEGVPMEVEILNK